MDKTFCIKKISRSTVPLPPQQPQPFFPFFPFLPFQPFSLCLLAAKPPFPPNYFHFCTCVNSVPTQANSRIHNALALVKPPFFHQKIIRTVRMRLFKTML
jgi:hypothetical protein